MHWASRNRFAPLSLGVALVSALLWAALYFGDAFDVLELDTVDARFTVRPEHSLDELAVVAIDDVTFSALNQRWPFKRSLHADVIDRLQAAGAKVVAYDVQFTEPSDVDEDNAMIEAADHADRILLGTTEVDAQGASRILGGDEVLAQIGARPGNTILRQDKGGVIRRFPYAFDGLESFAVVAAELASGRQVDPALFAGRDAWIDYIGPPGTVATYSFSNVLEGRFAPDAFRDRIVVVGASASRLHDVYPVPTSDDDLMSGAEVQANAIATMLRGLPLSRAGTAIALLAIALLSAVAPFTGRRWGTRGMLLSAAVAGLMYVALCFVAFRSGMILPLVHPLGGLATSLFGTLGVALVLGTTEHQRIRDTFGRFVPESVVSEVLEKTGDDLRLGGVRCTATVLFSDLRGFLGFAETRAPHVVIRVLNHYLESMSDVILDNGGTLVAYMGDGIMAVFGAPLEQPDHADRAVAAAREMAGERLSEFNSWLTAEGQGHAFTMGIGLNTGDVMSGNVGSMRRMEYTVIGDTTNTASRLEGMTKGTRHQVFMADSTRCCLSGDPDDLVEVGELDIRGRSHTLRVWALSQVDEPRA